MTKTEKGQENPGINNDFSEGMPFELREFFGEELPQNFPKLIAKIISKLADPRLSDEQRNHFLTLVIGWWEAKQLQKQNPNP